MNSRKALNQKKEKRILRVRSRIFGTKNKPRLSVFRSNRYISAQLIDDEQGRTLVSVTSRSLKADERKKKKVEQAVLVGEILAKKAGELGVKEVVFDRRSYKYHGRVLELANGVKKGGIKV